MMQTRTIRTAIVLALVGLFGGAFAQFGDALGTVDATFRGEERTWTTYDYPQTEEEGVPASANYVPFPGGRMEVSLTAFPEGATRDTVDGRLSISFVANGFPDACPCEFEDTTVLYFDDDTFFGDVFAASNDQGSVTLTFTRFERLEDGTVVAEGTFDAVLAFMPGEESERAADEVEPEPLEGRLETRIAADREISIE
jgi:hypothetical protein